MTFDILKEKKTYLLLLLFTLCAVGIVFYFLTKTDPTFLSSIPIIGKFFPASAVVKQSQTQNTSTPNAFQQQYAIGNGKVSSTVIPVSGKQLSPANAYANGIYDGVGTLPTGIIELQATIKQNTLTDILFEAVPVNVSENVLHALAKEAIQSQVVEVSPINGYDDISIAFKHALTDAVQKSFNVNNTAQ